MKALVYEDNKLFPSAEFDNMVSTENYIEKFKGQITQKLSVGNQFAYYDSTGKLLAIVDRCFNNEGH